MVTLWCSATNLTWVTVFVTLERESTNFAFRREQRTKRSSDMQCLDTPQGFGGYVVVQRDKPYLSNCICNTGKGKCKFGF